MIVTIDYETFYTQEYSLSRISEVDYILSPLFQTIMCSVKINAGPTVVYIGDGAVRAALAALPWERCALLSHNIRFDGAIAFWRLGIQPALYLDTLSMARAVYCPVGESVSNPVKTSCAFG